ncbi:DUF6894 family protein [Bradyrhizobium sp. GCM10027634]|uniref:DUF6894 family protein n=1 Tax=unclassified Bradyrhizobium TaxID=2631580 RepID=UPI00188B2302|nr:MULTISPECIES: hypothetical protein [unclassified Bradyrhizobium]MDN5001514.1 hypothetical protein [Bradyrhizobium sp. WYCCWR 12677]QOZ46143.1 hypothetical protein XH89_23690 [Bradyrhizobium sp. CCBAU 53340]
MRRYHFDLVDTNSVTDAGGALLADDDQARNVARDLAQEVRETRPQLVGRGYGISVRAANGAEVFRVEIDPKKENGR